MSKQILIDSYFGLVRTAIAQGTHLLDYYEESPEQGRTKGNIYRGVVKRVDANIQAAFIRYAGGRDGFLPLRDADSVSAVGGSLRVGDPLLVQVVKDEIGDKGAALTAKLSLSGRYLVYMPGRAGEGGISSRIGDDERSILKKTLAEMQIPEDGSVILRTAALNKGIAELQADLDRLSETCREIMDLFGKGKDPALLFREATPALRYLREYYSADVERIWVNEEDVLEQCRQFFFLYEPKSAAKVTLSKEGPLMFQKLGLEPEVDKLSLRKVGLPSGANIVIDQTEALVAIDVNSAKAGGRGDDSHSQNGLEETVFAVNKEAAVEISRQLRLRDLGGIIVVDFIDMDEERHRRQIEEIVRRSLASDKAKIKVFEISPLGTLQISRQRLRKAGPNFSRHMCEVCAGKGWHASPAVGAFAVLRRMEERLLGKKSPGGLTVAVPYPVANELVNEFRDQILAMEKKFACSIRITALPAQTGEPVFAAPAGGGEGGERNREATHREATHRPKAEGERSREPGRHGQERNAERKQDRNQDRNRNLNRDRKRERPPTQDQDRKPIQEQIPREAAGRPQGNGEIERVGGEGGRRRRSRRGGRHGEPGMARGNAPHGQHQRNMPGPRMESDLTPHEERLSHSQVPTTPGANDPVAHSPIVATGIPHVQHAQVESAPSPQASMPSGGKPEERAVAETKRPPARRRNAPPSRPAKESVPTPVSGKPRSGQSEKQPPPVRKKRPVRDDVDSVAGVPKSAPVVKTTPSVPARSPGGRAKPGERVRVEVLTKEPKGRPADAKVAQGPEAEAKIPRHRSRRRPHRG